MATPVGNVVSIDDGVFVAGLAQGGRWEFGGGPPVLTYSMHSDEMSGAWKARWREVMAHALGAWSDVADVRFVEIDGGDDARASAADLAFTLVSWPYGSLAGWACFPDPWFADAELYDSGSSREEWPRLEGDGELNVALPLLGYTKPGGSGLWVTLHETGHALGLKHPFDDGGNFRPTFASLGIAAYDAGPIGYPATPMPLDIQVIQSIYGPNRSHRTGDDVYPLVTDGVARTIWDAGGIDTLDASQLTGSAAFIDLQPGAFSYHGTATTWSGSARSVTGIAWDVAIEQAVGSMLDDSITGNALGNLLDGAGGNDVIVGGAGDDRLSGGPGRDRLDGGEGWDVASFAGPRRMYTVLATRDGKLAVGEDRPGGDGLDQLANVDALRFADGDVPATRAHSALEYVASYTDLAAAFGTDATAGFAHYVDHGHGEGRRAGFRGLDYVASHSDLANWLGPDAEAGASHYLGYGRAEGRAVTFNALEYVATHADLMNWLGADAEDGARHYIMYGRHEGRAATFDGLAYIASYGDLIRGFGADADAGATHFIDHGRWEGRQVSFDALAYIATYGDLIGAFGVAPRAGAQHFIGHGYTEGRGVVFDGLQYIASYGDLIIGLGRDAAAGATHFIAHGYAEGRARDTFDAQQYLANYADLRAAFGTDAEAATRHYIANGYAEGRTDQPLA